MAEIINRITPEKLESAAEMLKAIAHPLRLAIIDFIGEDEKSVTEIFEHLNIEQAVASHHLSILKKNRVVQPTRDGKHIYYSIKHEKIITILECIEKCQPRLM